MAWNDYRKKVMKKELHNKEKKNWEAELDSFMLYRILSKVERDQKKRILFKKLSAESMNQSGIWRKMAEPSSKKWNYQIPTKIKFIALLLNWLGPKYIIHFLPAAKVRGLSTYRSPDKEHYKGLNENEKVHSKVMSGSNLRAAIFGINDGLVSNASLVFAMVGAGSDNKTIIITGISGLLAGSFSMATGEYISVQSQTELYRNQIEIEEQELKEFPDEEAKELSLIYQAKGMDKVNADLISENLVRDPKKALDTLVREELGLNPNELGSALGASISSFLSFSLGAIVPLIPYFFFSKSFALPFSITSSSITLFVVGIFISFITGKSALMNGLRMCLLGWAAGLATYFIGYLLGSAV